MTSVLCHLGDSPMHAEVTNTMNPTSSLSPCRVCHLKVKSLMDKRSSKYISDFVGIDEQGNKASLPTRNWSETIAATHELWHMAQKPGTIGQFDTKSSELGVKDALNMSFVKMVQDLHRDSSVSVEQISTFCDDLNGQFGDRLFNPFLQLKGFNGHRDTPVEPRTMIQNFLSLNGKEFRTVLQCAPFIFLECNMSNEEHEAWKALSHLAPYIFQTDIGDVKTYRENLQRLVRIFLKAIIQLSAQWCNKPKFHMLIHLCDAINQFGPPCLFATENFESYNGNTRESSIHSNHLSPGRDIANSCNNNRLMRAFGAGSHIYDHKLKTYIHAGRKVQETFRNNRLFQRALGFNALWNQENSVEFGRSCDPQPFNANERIPKDICEEFTAKDWRILESLTLKNKQKVASEVFVSLKKINTSTSKQIARVLNIWAVGGCLLHQTKVQANLCLLGQVNGFYGMRELAESDSVIWINPAEIEGVLNVQHNCHVSKCQVSKNKSIMIERRLSKKMDFAVVHEPNKDFIINSGSFYSCEIHRFWANIPFNEVSPHDWRVAVKKGIDVWQQTLRKKDQAKERHSQKMKDKYIASQAGHVGKKRRTQVISQDQSASPVQNAGFDGPLPGPSTW
ncbi:hypothetical protein DFH28DRAFT_936321 [Melampsora americana]|nr:hypothetical protein DFH28DRAFT_936321 [Melampsora americana]